MFYPAKMKSVDIIVERSKLDFLLKELHRTGLMEIEDVQSADKDYLDMVKRSAPPSDIREISSLLIRAEELLSDFSLAGESISAGIKDMLFPDPPEKAVVRRKSTDDLKKEASELFETVEKDVRDLADKILYIREKIGKKRAQLEDLQKIMSMDIDLSLLGRGDYVVAKIGEIKEMEAFKKEVKGSPILYDYTVYFRKKKLEKYALLAVCYIKDEERLNMALRKAGFQEFDFEGLEGRPDEADRAVRNEIVRLEKELKSVKDELRRISSKWKKKIEVLVEELEIERDRLDAIANMGRTEHVYVISGWVPEKSAPHLEKLVKKASENHALVFFEDPEKTENVPVKMENPRWARPFEFLTKMFAVPRYGEIDPTMIIAPIFIIYFGLMLGDAMYGVIITIGGWIIYRGMGRVDEASRHFGIVITLAGISTVIFGILQGGYLGPFNDQAPNLPQLFGISIPSLLDSMKDPITMLVIGLLIGLAHLNLGLFLGAVQNIREGKKKDALIQQGTWWLLQPGGFILISGKLFRWYNYSQNIYILAWLMVGVGLVLLIMAEKGLFFFGITGFLGNFLSYARILALGLGTAGIALTVNILTNLVVSGASQSLAPVCGALAIVGAGFGALSLKKPRKRYKILGVLFLIFGIVGFISVPAAFMLLGAIMFISGHIINTGLQALGSFVHSLRLQYVEFFGYFYEGGGREFQPYEEKRRITEVKEVYE